MSRIVSPDIFTRHAPFGLAFRDASDLSLVGDALHVRLCDPRNAEAETRLFATSGGTWTAPRLPGVGAAIAADPAGWEAQARSFRVEVRDLAGRFLPARFTARLPVRGRFHWPEWEGFEQARIRPLLHPDPPEGHEIDHLPLFPSIARTPPGPRATVRAHLAYRLEDGSDRPASWAAMTVNIGNRIVGLGVADAGGAVAASFAYPPLPGQTATEAAAGRSEIGWAATLRVYHGGLSGDPPDMAAILSQLSQPVRQALAKIDEPDGEPAAQTLILGRPLIAVTLGEDGKPLSSLYLKPA